MADNLLSADEAIEKALKTATSAEVEENEDEQEGEEQTSTEEETEESESEETEDSEPDKGKTKKKSTEDETEQSDDDTQESDESSEIDERTADALALWDSLESENALEVLQQIADKAGLRLVSSTDTGTKGATKNETKISTLEVAKQIFGKDYEFIAEKVALVLDKVLEEKVEKPLRQSAQEQEIRTLNSEVSTFLKTNKDAVKHSRKIAALINEMPPRPGVDLQIYLGRIYKLVSGDAAETTRVRKVVDKISANAKRTNTRSSEVSAQSVKKGSKLPSIDEALDAAAKGIKFDFEE